MTTQTPPPADLMALIPTNWCDPLLTGPNKALPDGGQYNGTDIERLLLGIRKRLADHIEAARPSLSAQAVGECTHCDGAGGFRRAVCCGNGTPLGDCCGNPNEEMEPCGQCGGSGTTPPQPADGGDRVVAGYVVSSGDGSIGDRIAPEGWITKDSILERMKAEPWVQCGRARIIPLYFGPEDSVAALAKFQPAGGENDGR